MLPFSCPFQLSSSIEFRRVFGSRSEGKLIASIAQIVLHEGDQPDPVPDLRHADILAREGVAEIELPGPEKQIRLHRVTVMVVSWNG